MTQIAERPVTIITGAGRGIGRETASLMANRGYHVVAVSRTEAEIQSLVAELKAAKLPPPLAFRCDVSKADEAAEMIQEVIHQFNRIDALINNAGITGPRASLEDIAPAEWDNVLAVNVSGAANCARAALPMLKCSYGTIVNVLGGKIGWKGIPDHETAYISSKFALWGFTESLASELKSTGVRVNGVSPGPVDTLLARKFARSNGSKEKHVGFTPELAARAIAFLATEESAPLTGKIISARWDNLREIAANGEQLNQQCKLTLRRIDERNFDILE